MLPDIGEHEIVTHGCDGEKPGLAKLPFDIVFRASDGFNDVSKTVRITVTTNRPPVISVLPTAAPFVTVGETVTLTEFPANPAANPFCVSGVR